MPEAFSPDGQTIASGSADKSIKIWNVRTGMLQRELKGHTESANAVANRSGKIGPDNQTLVSGSKDKTIKIWNMITGKRINSLTGHSILSVAISPDRKNCASGSKDDTIKIWNLSSGELCQTLSGHADAVKSVAFSLDGRSLVSPSLGRNPQNLAI
ncbi:MAG: WD40 repeat domain-containing protein [Hormoscilla sp. GM7CHS1pb]|nr:WD40 repeat domain-containing protein [Hormoscilla sp. GM7CHS1pb]